MKSQKSQNILPFTVASHGDGQVFEIPSHTMAGRQLNRLVAPRKEELIPLPFGSLLYELPGRLPVGYDSAKGRFMPVDGTTSQPLVAVAAFLPPAFTQLYLAAWQTRPQAPTLPLFAYTPVGFLDDMFWVPAVRVDTDMRHDPASFNDDLIENGILRLQSLYPRNRLIAHLIDNCIRRYHCPNAQNLALGRWESPVPISPACNAACAGCISRQAHTGISSTQQRIDFIPDVGEIVEYTVPHLENAPNAIISFGQGCEGEPLLQADLLEAAIRDIRKKTPKGTIHLNSNGSKPQVIERLCRAGLDSIRVSINSAQQHLYQKYFCPQDYHFSDVLETLAIVRRYNRWISLNYFIFPGLTDQPEEMTGLVKLLKEHAVDFIQMRNLNIDPEWYMQKLELFHIETRPVGIIEWMQEIKKQVSWIRFGYFNPAKEDW
jgi:wyosine [tRNA(Phe)-imidazoG37] synthetase (radical SAM superfamily)